MEYLSFKEFEHTKFEYYPGNKVLIKTTLLGVNTLIQVYKPGTYKDNWSGFSINPVVLISMNGTGMIDLNEFDILKKMTTVAIQILNKEKEGIIEPNKINVDGGYTKEKQLYTTAKNVKKTKYIRKQDLKVGHIYQEENGRKSIYFGNSHLYDYDKGRDAYYHLNRTNNGSEYCRYIFGEESLIDTIHKGIHINSDTVNIAGYQVKVSHVTMLNDSFCSSIDIDSRTTLRKFVKDLGGIGITEDSRIIKLCSITTGKQVLVIVRKPAKPEYIPPKVTRTALRIKNGYNTDNVLDALLN